MDMEQQRFMAREGLIMWLQGAIQLAAEMSRWVDCMHEVPQAQFADARRAFQRNRLFFLIAAHTFFAYRDWSVATGLLPKSSFKVIDAFKDDVNTLRNKNVHVVGYLKKEDGEDWWHESPHVGRIDASATFETKIGGRVDWVDFSKAAQRLLEGLV